MAVRFLFFFSLPPGLTIHRLNTYQHHRDGPFVPCPRVRLPLARANRKCPHLDGALRAPTLAHPPRPAACVGDAGGVPRHCCLREGAEEKWEASHGGVVVSDLLEGGVAAATALFVGVFTTAAEEAESNRRRQARA